MTLSLWDRGLHYGDGVFRTFPLRHGKIPFFERQLQKLQDDCQSLAMTPPELDFLKAKVLGAIEQLDNAAIKIIVTRGNGQRGYAPSVSQGPNIFVLTSTLTDYAAKWRQGISLRLCQLRLSRQPKLAGIKHLNRLEQVLARAEWHDPSIDEGLLLDENEHVIEGVMSNLFVWDGQQLITPPLDHCGVKGLIRDLLLETLPKLGLVVKVEPVPLERIKKARALLMTNSLWGIMSVRQFESWRYADFTIANICHEALASI
jgi:4-amino-4-deoxychorismate lyase